ncbi:MAG TPA: YicC/YloC family endoribonuclease [Pseudomonadales bacterium]|nr:YicC/YloC family endoribonuclease [Pseudomonadales bacterium]
MIYSMTAFARATEDSPQGSVTCEIRSVNSRYLEPHFKLPDILRGIESPLRDLLRHALGRGKIEIALRYQASHEQQDGLKVNHALAQQLLQSASVLASDNPSVGLIDPLDILRWPGVIQESPTDEDNLQKTALVAAERAIADLKTARAREGEMLAGFISQRLDAIATICDDIEKILPDILAHQRQRLTSRLAELSEQLDNERVEQEMVLLLQRADVDEELDRLRTHVAEVRRVLKKGGHCGRRLDFLMQELNREANTLSSKSQAATTTNNAVELKVLIEQMREQIQNLE